MVMLPRMTRRRSVLARASAWMARIGRRLSLVSAVWAAEANAEELTLAAVLDSTLEHHPKISAIDAKVEQAGAARVAARGAFDLKLEAGGDYSPVGTYERAYGRVGLHQPTPWWGLELSGKYENGADFPVYEGGLVTSELGKVSLSAVLPLLRGRQTDPARFELIRSRLGEAIAGEIRRGERAELLAKAATTFWKWVVTGRKLDTYRKLVRQAEERRDFLESQATSGALPRVEVVDNERLLSSRRAALAVLQLEFDRASLALGMFRRDAKGNPRPAASDELPSRLELPTVDEADLGILLADVSHTPGLVVYDLLAQTVADELRLAQNDRLPLLDFELNAAAGAGQSRPYSSSGGSISEATLRGRLSFSWALQQRQAVGKVAATFAKKRELESERRLLLDRLSLEVEGQTRALAAQRQAAVMSRLGTSQAEEVLLAERMAFESGQSSVLAINLREQALGSAYLAELEALLEYYEAWVELQRLLGRDDPNDYAAPGGTAN